MFEITNEWLMVNSTKKGGWTKKQAEVLCFGWPLKKGWKKQVIGNFITDKDKFKFENAANITCKTKNILPVDNELLNLLTVKRKRVNEDILPCFNRCPTALELIRCGIGSNYGGSYYDEVLELVLQPILDYVNKRI